MEIEGRLSDVLNRRESIPIGDVLWAPVDGSAETTPAPGLERVDPFDLIVVFAGEGSLPSLTEAERAAHQLHKVSYDVALEVPPYRVVGTVYLFPGSEPDRLLDRSTELFVPGDGRGGCSWRTGRSAMPAWRSCSSTAPTCAASSRSTSGRSRRRGRSRAARGPADRVLLDGNARRLAGLARQVRTASRRRKSAARLSRGAGSSPAGRRRGARRGPGSPR